MSAGQQRDVKVHIVAPAFLDAVAAHFLAAPEPAIFRWMREEAKQRDEQLRREHPWRWRQKRAARWIRRRVDRLAPHVPVRWVGFGVRGWDVE